jgi:hypothetical protein
LILTGSSTPNDSEQKHLHSGAGRIGRIQMRPFTLFESKVSNGKVKLSSLFDRKEIEKNTGKLNLTDLAQIIVKGG